MKSSKKKWTIIVAIFVCVALGIFVLGILTLGGQRKTFVRSITTKAYFKNINGLQAGNNIWYSGVKVGTVKKVSFTKSAGIEVLMNIERQSQSYIPKDAIAKIGSDGLIGNRIIVISGGTLATASISAGDTFSVESALGLDDLVSTLQKNNLNLLNVTGNLKMISTRLVNGQGTLGKLLTDESLIKDIQSVVRTLKQASTNTKVFTENFKGYSDKLQEKGGLANDLVSDTLVFAKLRETVSQLEEMTLTANKVINNLQKASEGLNNKANPAGALLNDPEITSDLKSILKNLKSGTQKLDENMEALQHNFLLRGYFKKKEKSKPSTSF